MKTPAFRKTVAALLAAACATLTVHASTFTVGGSGNNFIITRTGDTSAAETVRYRTVSLSALAGQHFTDKSGLLTFAPGLAQLPLRGHRRGRLHARLKGPHHHHRHQRAFERRVQCDERDGGLRRVPQHRQRLRQQRLQDGCLLHLLQQNRATDLVPADRRRAAQAGPRPTGRTAAST